MFRKIVMTIFKVKKSKEIDWFTLTIKSLRSSETSGTIHSMNHRQIREDFNFHVHSHRGGTSNLTHEEGIFNTRGNARVSVGICSDEPRCLSRYIQWQAALLDRRNVLLSFIGPTHNAQVGLKVALCNVEWEDDCEPWIVKCVKGSGHGIVWLTSKYADTYTAISRLTPVIRSWQSDVLRGNANREPVAHYFKWQKLWCVTTATQNPQSVSQNVTKTQYNAYI